MEPIRRVAFFGSPEFALPTLDALAESRFRPILVVSQPPRPAGRGQKAEDTAVALRARSLGIEVWQPEKVKDPAFLDSFRALDVDVAVVVAFGQIFPRSLLALPRLGCINLHGSLLPRHRGAAPIQASIASGDRTTGVTTMRMEAGLDTGPILLQSSTQVTDEDDTPSLAARLATLGASLMIETLERLEAGDLVERRQDDSLATLAPRLDKRDARIDWTLDAATLSRRLRAFTPWPGLVSLCAGEPLKLHRARPLETRAAVLAGELDGSPPGTFLGLAGDAIAVAAGKGTTLGLLRVQRPGRRALDAPEFLRGESLAIGKVEFTAPTAPES